MSSRSDRKKFLLLLLLLAAGVLAAGLLLVRKIAGPAAGRRHVRDGFELGHAPSMVSETVRAHGPGSRVKAGPAVKVPDSRKVSLPFASPEETSGLYFFDPGGRPRPAPQALELQEVEPNFPSASMGGSGQPYDRTRGESARSAPPEELKSEDSQSDEPGKPKKNRNARRRARPATAAPGAAEDLAVEDYILTDEELSGSTVTAEMEYQDPGFYQTEGITARAKEKMDKRGSWYNLFREKIRVMSGRWNKEPPPIEDLRRRTFVSRQGGSSPQAERAAGTQDTVYWGKRGSTLVIPDEELTRSLGAKNIPDPQGIKPGDPANQNVAEGMFMGWVFSWRPRMIEVGGQTGARQVVVSKWQSWQAALNQQFGNLKLPGQDVKKLVQDFLGDISGWNEILSNVVFWFFENEPAGCVSFYSDVDITMIHPRFGTISIPNCAGSWSAPPPFVLSRCVGSGESPNDGFETVVPPIYAGSLFNLPEVMVRQGCDWNSDLCVESVPSGFYRRSPGETPGGADGGPNNPKHIVRIVQHLGYGVFRLQYGVCVKCENPDDADDWPQTHPSFWPSIYFNLYRNFDGSTTGLKRCLPASAPNRKVLIACTRWGNCALEKRCNFTALRDFKRHSADFRKLAEQNPQMSTEQVCDMYYKITPNIQQCLASGGNSWPEPLPAGCQ